MNRFNAEKDSAMKKAIISATATSCVLLANMAQAIEFNRGDLSGSWDTTLSYGIISRLKDSDDELIGIASGGTSQSVNNDDGNQNYGKGIVSNVFKITSEVELNYRNHGGFVRATGFYDYENMDGERDRTDLSDDAKDLVGRDIKLLDAYLWSYFDIGQRATEVRLGNQTLSWGESTFIQNSINTINPIDVNKFRIPGSELREALVPVPILSTALETSENSSVELFYQLQWEQTTIDPTGSYFSVNDYAGDGGERVMLGWGAIPDTVPRNFVPPGSTSTTVVARAEDEEAKDDGQFGAALRLYSPRLNDTEFGFYYINYHSRLPIINARTGTREAALGMDPDGRSYVETARYFISYPEDISLYGFSFNTSLGRSGIALQGEVSYRQDVPLQIDDVEILIAALGAQDDLDPGNTGAAAFAEHGQLGAVGFDTVIPGYIQRDVSQAQVTATKIFGPALGANATVVLGEVGVTQVMNMPDKDVLRLNGPGTFISGNAAFEQATTAALHPDEIEAAKHFADATSWGYRLLTRMQFDNAFKSINLAPRLVWQHDVSGISPGPGGNFVEGRRSVTIGLSADYQNTYSADISITTFAGAGRYNLLRDRDFVAANIKYSF